MLSEEICSSSLQCLVCHKHNISVHCGGQVHAESVVKDARSLQCREWEFSTKDFVM